MESFPNANGLPQETGGVVVEDIPEEILNEVAQAPPQGVTVDKLGRRLYIGAGAAVGGMLIAAQPVAAEVVINWSDIGNYFTGIASIMPGLGTLIGAIVGPLILLSVVGFLTGTLDEILGGIRNAFSRLGR